MHSGFVPNNTDFPKQSTWVYLDPFGSLACIASPWCGSWSPRMGKEQCLWTWGLPEKEMERATFKELQAGLGSAFEMMKAMSSHLTPSSWSWFWTEARWASDLRQHPAHSRKVSSGCKHHRDSSNTKFSQLRLWLVQRRQKFRIILPEI